MKNIYLVIVFIIFVQCGFKPMLTNKEVNFKIENIKSNEKVEIIENRLNNLNISDPKFFYDLEINYSETKTTLSKNSKGKSLLLRIKMSLNLKVVENDKIIMQKNYFNNFDYQNLDKKFELSDYENEIKKNMFNEIANKILIDLTDLK